MRPTISAVFLSLSFIAACGVPTARAAGNTDGKARLRSDEGYLIMAVRSTDHFRKARFEDPVGKQNFILEGISPGETLWLMRAKAGRYFLQYMRPRSNMEITWRSSDENAFWLDVEAGKLNYPGDLFLRDEGRRLYYHHGAHGLDELGERLRRTPDLPADLLERMPFRLVGDLAKEERPWLSCQPGDDARWRDWVACQRPLAGPEPVTLLSAVFERNDLPGIALGMPRGQVMQRVKSVSRRLAGISSLEGVEDFAWVGLGGWWGERGSSLVARLWFEDGRLARVSLRQIGPKGVWQLPAPDAYADLVTYAAGQ